MKDKNQGQDKWECSDFQCNALFSNHSLEEMKWRHVEINWHLCSSTAAVVKGELNSQHTEIKKLIFKYTTICPMPVTSAGSAQWWQKKTNRKQKQCKKRMKRSKGNVSSLYNYRMFYLYCKDQEANWPIFPRLTHVNRQESLDVVVFFFFHHCIIMFPTQQRVSTAIFNVLWKLQALAYSLAVVSQTVPIV